MCKFCRIFLLSRALRKKEAGLCSASIRWETSISMPQRTLYKMAQKLVY